MKKRYLVRSHGIMRYLEILRVYNLLDLLKDTRLSNEEKEMSCKKSQYYEVPYKYRGIYITGFAKGYKVIITRRRDAS